MIKTDLYSSNGFFLMHKPTRKNDSFFSKNIHQHSQGFQYIIFDPNKSMVVIFVKGYKLSRITGIAKVKMKRF